MPCASGERLWICPHHEQVEEPDAVVVKMDPGLAFGTGTHPTTALCLEWLDRVRWRARGSSTMDAGRACWPWLPSSWGRREAHCFDIDPQALIATAG